MYKIKVPIRDPFIFEKFMHFMPFEFHFDFIMNLCYYFQTPARKKRDVHSREKRATDTVSSSGGGSIVNPSSTGTNGAQIVLTVSQHQIIFSNTCTSH